MPPIEIENLNQLAVLWPWTGSDEANEPTFGPPVEIPVHWEWRTVETVDPKGGTAALTATAVVDRKIHRGSTLWLAPDNTVGTALSQWYASGSVGQEDDLMVVLNYDEVPDLRGVEVHRGVGMARFRDASPGS